MKTIELANGQIIEEYETQKEVIEMVMDCVINNKEYLDDEFALYIQYKDETHYSWTYSEEYGKFKKTGIDSLIFDNPSTYGVYGNYELMKTDDTDDDINCVWIVR